MKQIDLIAWTLTGCFCFAAVFLVLLCAAFIAGDTIKSFCRSVRQYKDDSRARTGAKNLRVSFDCPQEYGTMPNENSSTRFSVTQRQKITLRFVDRHDVDAPIDGSPSVVSSDSNVVEVEQTEGGYWLKGKSVGNATVTITADARIGDGVQNLTETIDVEITPDEAVDIEPTFEEPQDQPTP